MGGLGPGIGGLEILVIGLLALIVVGPKDLPLLMRKVGQALAKARAMANEFRSSFDELARQSELDELRKEVDALRRGQGMVPLGAEAEAAFKDISAELNAPGAVPPAALPGPAEWPEPSTAMVPALDPVAQPTAPEQPLKRSNSRARSPAPSQSDKTSAVDADLSSETIKAVPARRKSSARRKAAGT